MLGGGCVLVYQIYSWLRYGVWPPLKFAQLWLLAGWGWPSVHWAGLQKIINEILLAILRFPMGTGLIVAGAVLGFGCLVIGLGLEERAQKKNPDK